MKVIIVGLGKFGRKVLQFLSEEGHDIVVVDKDEEKIQTVVERYDVFGVCGNGVLAENLKEAGAESAELLIAVTPSDEQNVLCCMVAKSIGVKNTIARVRDPEYNDQADFMREQFGIDRLLNPEKALAQEITRILRFPSAEKIHSFADGKVEIVETKLSSLSPLIGKKLSEISGKDKKFSVLFAAIERKGEIIVPNGETALEAGDIVSLCAKHNDLYDFLKSQGQLKKKVQCVMILGADRMAYYLAKDLVKYGIPVKIISPHKEKCEAIASAMSGVTIVCDDFTDKDVLEGEGLADAGAVVAMTAHDENNIMISLFAKQKNVEKTVTVLRNESYHGIIDSLFLDSVISPYQVVAEDCVRYFRSVSVPEGSRIAALYKIAGEKAEAIQFNVNAHKAFSDRAIRDIRLRSGVLITAIIRGKTMVIPTGDTVVEKDDSMIVICKQGSVVSSLDDILR